MTRMYNMHTRSGFGVCPCAKISRKNVFNLRLMLR